MDMNNYDYIIVAFSGGKDSTACFLNLLDSGVDKNKIELWHHLIDGSPGSEPFMDWPITEDYCREFAKEFNIPIYFSWREGGFIKEMLRDNTMTAPVRWENPNGSIGTAGGKGPLKTRRQFPQVGSINSGRWCSAKLKIDVMSAAINNQERFKGKKTLVVTGERAEESKSRANYETFEKHRSNTKTRTVDHWRPIHDWKEEQVWGIIEKHDVWSHPAYYLGWNRLSCITCIFGNANQWASAAHIYPEMVEKIAQYEEEFGYTIKRNRSVRELINKGEIYKTVAHMHGDWIHPTMKAIIKRRGIRNTKTPLPLKWELPAGAYGESVGPN